MKQLIIDLPDTMDMEEKEVKIALAAKLYEMGKLTLGQAADMTNHSKEHFMELLGDYGVSLFNYDPEDLDEDVKNAEDHSL
ncbi:putative HTH domain antitoxin [Catalinimonas alkaloidigena]|uniref:UPF0175 family protein n=1 Tax=Catalinimonas alkaloidigena TaxID=1075417 RepID=UPI0024049FFC|nr:UPF0175 family protein [Catalinimonas alkaloidigena]MDF9800261.1 putative HTH domain antitoxin [Catalinimonas alkaloidigena]